MEAEHVGGGTSSFPAMRMGGRVRCKKNTWMLFFLCVCTFHTCPHYVSFSLKMSEQLSCRHVWIQIWKMQVLGWFKIVGSPFRFSTEDGTSVTGMVKWLQEVSFVYLFWYTYDEFLHIYVIYIYVYISRYYKERQIRRWIHGCMDGWLNKR